MSQPRVVRYQPFKRTGQYRRQKQVGEPTDIRDWAAIVAGLNALGLDGYALVVGNDRNDLPEDGGIYGSEMSADVVGIYLEKMRLVEPGALAASAPDAPETLGESFLVLVQVFEDAASHKYGLLIGPVED